MLSIDGSQGEGGGQILRTSLSLSVVTAQPFRLTAIRAGRRRPGLLHQHLTAVRAAAEISQATLSGDSLGSTELEFRPGRVTPGEYRFSVGTAGSATLVLQTLLPALWTAPGASVLHVEGGTHNMAAPPFDFLDRAFLPLVVRQGPRVTASLDRYGFYPAGGGRIRVEIQPAARLAPLELIERGPLVHRGARALVSRLPRHIAERELRILGERLGLGEDVLIVEEVRDAAGPGNVVIIELASRHVTEVFTGFGQRGVRAEAVAGRAAAEAARYLAADVPVGQHLADQLLLPLALARGGRFRTLPLTQHAVTNIDVIRRFLDVEIASDEIGTDRWEVSV